MWLFFIPKNTHFHSSNAVLVVSSLTPILSLLSFGDFMSGKANTSVISVLFWEAHDDECLDGVDEPQ